MRVARLSPAAPESSSLRSVERVERRSSARPCFSQGWRKEFGSGLHVSLRTPNTSPDLVEIWTASARSLLKAHSCLQVLDDSDRTEIGAIANIDSLESALAARILLRLALSRASNHTIPPASWRFVRLESGKLEIAKGLPQIRFSISHCDALVGVVASSTLDVGLDIESVDSPMSLPVKDSFLTYQERRRLAELDVMQGLRGAIRIWTLKEAFSKLLGSGFASEFQEMDFRLFPKPELVSEQSSSDTPAHFESLYIDARNSLCLATLAVGAQLQPVIGEIRFLKLIEDEHSDGFGPAPSVAASLGEM
jgi:phosphopantetheinyl transferase